MLNQLAGRVSATKPGAVRCEGGSFLTPVRGGVVDLVLIASA